MVYGDSETISDLSLLTKKWMSPRSDLLLGLVKAGSRGDQPLFKRTLEAIIAEERKKQHHVLADRLAEYLRNGNGELKSVPVIDDRVLNLLYEVVPQKQLDDLLLPPNVRCACVELIEEHRRRDLLRSFGVEPRHRILVAGPPGNGKTSLAEALAEALMVPLVSVRYDGIIGSFLGETTTRLRRVFDHVRSRHCVLFFDEFETLGKERGDTHEAGEIKRVVSSLLLEIDRLPSHVLVVTATNHPELLDRAVWRRFQLRMELPLPREPEILEWLLKFERRTNIDWGIEREKLAKRLAGLSFAEVEEFGMDVVRRTVLDTPEANPRKIVQERLLQLEHRFSVRRSEPASNG